MSAQLPPSDVALKDLVVEHTRAGDLEAAKRTAVQIVDHMLQRQAWLQILHTQRDRLNDLQGVKETILSLPDSDLWLGSWVHDLVLDTARSGDINGAKAIVAKLPEDSPRGNFLSLIAFVQAQEGHYREAESTLAPLAPDNIWRDLGLASVIRAMVNRGDRGEAEVLAKRVTDPQIKTNALQFCNFPIRSGNAGSEPSLTD